MSTDVLRNELTALTCRVKNCSHLWCSSSRDVTNLIGHSQGINFTALSYSPLHFTTPTVSALCTFMYFELKLFGIAPSFTSLHCTVFPKPAEIASCECFHALLLVVLLWEFGTFKKVLPFYQGSVYIVCVAWREEGYLVKYSGSLSSKELKKAQVIFHRIFRLK